MALGVLHIKLERAENLKNTKLFGSPIDPYVVMEFQSQTKRTVTYFNAGVNPELKCEESFVVKKLTPADFSIKIKDEEVIKDHFMGRAHIDVSSLLLGEKKLLRGPFPLLRKSGKPAGQIHMMLLFQAAHSNSPHPLPAQPRALSAPTDPHQPTKPSIALPGSAPGLENMARLSIQSSLSNHQYGTMLVQLEADLMAQMQRWARINADCQTTGTSFEDPDFPRKFSSLQTKEDLQWARPTTLIPTGWTLFPSKTVCADEVRQRSLGDCWFLSSVAALADTRPDELERVFLTKDYNSNGAYLLKFCKDGMWQPVMVDDYFPIKNNHLAFAQPEKQGLWGPLLEKAYAKLHGSYGSIVGGGDEALIELTGWPTVYLKTADGPMADPLHLWNCLKQWKDQGFVMVAACSSNAKGLEAEHMYSLLGVEKIPDKDVRLVKLRNPWGHGEWKGSWSDEAADWTTSVKEKVNHTSIDDGVFCMTATDFQKHFESMCVCHIRDGWQENRFSGSFGGDQIFAPHGYFFQVSCKLELMVAIFFSCVRAAGGKRKPYHGEFIVSRYPCTGPADIITFKGETPAGCGLMHMAHVKKLEPGSYVVVPFTLDAADQTGFALGIFTSAPVKAVRSPIKFEDCRSIMLSAVINKAQLSAVEGSKHSSVTSCGEGCFFYVANLEDSAGFGVAENLSSSVWLRIETGLVERGLESSLRQGPTLVDVLPPKTRQLVFAFRPGGYQYTSKVKMAPKMQLEHSPPIVSGSIFSTLPAG